MTRRKQHTGDTALLNQPAECWSIALTMTGVRPLGVMEASHAVLRYTKRVLCHFRLIARACGSALLANAARIHRLNAVPLK